MERYTIYCTAEQTKKALELGAPIEPTGYGDGFIKQVLLENPNSPFGRSYYDIPTAEQMIGWLEEQEGINNIVVAKPSKWVFMIGDDDICYHSTGKGFTSRKEATLAAIDAALDYLFKNK